MRTWSGLCPAWPRPDLGLQSPDVNSETPGTHQTNCRQLTTGYYHVLLAQVSFFHTEIWLIQYLSAKKELKQIIFYLLLVC